MDLNICSKLKRTAAFFIDRLILFPIWVFICIRLFAKEYYITLLEDIKNMNFFHSVEMIILIVLYAYLILLAIYFIYFVIIQLFFNITVGKFICGIRLVSYKNNEITKPDIKCLLLRYFLLYIAGVGALGYAYPFHASKESLYDDITNTRVILK